MAAPPRSEDLEGLLGRAGSPAAPPAWLGRAILARVGEPAAAPRPRPRGPVALVAAVAIVLAAGLAVTPHLVSPPPAFALDVHGPGGATAYIVGRAPEGANRPIHLEAQRLTGDGYYELWSVHGTSRMLLATFMTNRDGSCQVSLSIPSTVQPGDLVIAPQAVAQ